MHALCHLVSQVNGDVQGTAISFRLCLIKYASLYGHTSHAIRVPEGLFPTHILLMAFRDVVPFFLRFTAKLFNAVFIKV